MLLAPCMFFPKTVETYVNIDQKGKKVWINTFLICHSTLFPNLHFTLAPWLSFLLWPFWFFTKSREMLTRFIFFYRKKKPHKNNPKWKPTHVVKLWLYEPSVALTVFVSFSALGGWFGYEVPCIKAKATCTWLLEVSLSWALVFLPLTPSKN